ncbi:hypothetical protein ACFC1T_08800 [Kitasatospora sp. NPDC056076]|uniref:hypothetical protein n=1 Tax=Kitasatospora sp. NPDC056076 TaxID=3345703 RepID=UPI0035D8AD0A
MDDHRFSTNPYDDDVDDDDVPWETTPVCDPRTGAVRVIGPDKCTTCIYRKDSALKLAPGRLKSFAEDAARNSTHIVCHETYSPGFQTTGEGAICRGFASSKYARRSRALLAAAIVGRIVEVAPPRPVPGVAPMPAPRVTPILPIQSPDITIETLAALFGDAVQMETVLATTP